MEKLSTLFTLRQGLLRLFTRLVPSVGTRSLLFGAHCFFIHPFFVAAAWYKLYGLKAVNDPYIGSVSLKSFPLWIAFFIHDWGYFGKPNMDGKEGELHTIWAARIMSSLFDRKEREEMTLTFEQGSLRGIGYDWYNSTGLHLFNRFGSWGSFCLYHSRFIAKRDSRPYSALCVADKFSISLEPWWLYIPRATLSREIYEYMDKARISANGEGKYGGEPKSKYFHMHLQTGTKRSWFVTVCKYLEDWAYTYKDLDKVDTHTPVTKPEIIA